MEGSFNNPAPAAAPPAPPAAPVAAPVAPAMPAAPAAPASFDNGGSTSSGGGLKGFFDDINALDMLFMILGTASLVYIIYYHRQNIKFRKSEYIDLINRLDKTEAQLSAIKTSTAKAAANGKVGINGMSIRRRFRA